MLQCLPLVQEATAFRLLRILGLLNKISELRRKQNNEKESNFSRAESGSRSLSNISNIRPTGPGWNSFNNSQNWKKSVCCRCPMFHQAAVSFRATKLFYIANTLLFVANLNAHLCKSVRIGRLLSQSFLLIGIWSVNLMHIYFNWALCKFSNSLTERQSGFLLVCCVIKSFKKKCQCLTDSYFNGTNKSTWKWTWIP